MSSERLHDQLMAAVERAERSGSPVAGRGPAERDLVVRAAIRRWDSFARRNPRAAGDVLERRVEDLAKGLRERVDSLPTLTGPLMADYRWLAGRLAAILAEPGPASGPGPGPGPGSDPDPDPDPDSEAGPSSS